MSSSPTETMEIQAAPLPSQEQQQEQRPGWERWPWQQHQQQQRLGARSDSESTLNGGLRRMQSSMDLNEKAAAYKGPMTEYYPRRPSDHAHAHHAADVGLGNLNSHPGLIVTVLLLVLVGLRPARLEAQLRTKDDKAWEDFRDKLISRWETLLVTVGLILTTAASVIFSDRAHAAAYVLGMASFACATISITFGTGLGFVFKDAPAETFMALIRRPLVLLVLLATPSFFAIGSMLTLYGSIVAIAFQDIDDELANVLARIGTTGGAVLMAIMFTASLYLVKGLEAKDRRPSGQA